MTIRQQPESMWQAVILYGTAALIILNLLPGCSMLQTQAEQPVAERTQAEKVADLRKRLLATHHKMHMQRAELKKLLNNETDLEHLMRSMQVKQQKAQFTGDGAGKTKEVTVDYLQVMAANQNALKTDISKLMEELKVLQAPSDN